MNRECITTHNNTHGNCQHLHIIYVLCTYKHTHIRSSHTHEKFTRTFALCGRLPACLCCFFFLSLTFGIKRIIRAQVCVVFRRWGGVRTLGLCRLTICLYGCNFLFQCSHIELWINVIIVVDNLFDVCMYIVDIAWSNTRTLCSSVVWLFFFIWKKMQRDRI